MNNKELVGLLREAAEVCDDALENGIGDDLRAAADTLEKAAEGVEPVADAEAELIRYREGYKGSCYACETVGEKNVELQTKLAATEADAARYRWLLDNAVWRCLFKDGLALVVPDDMPLSAVDAAIDAARSEV